MNYPVWDPPFVGGGLLIAVVGIVHVVVSHFAVGGGLFLALWEGRARREGDAAKLAYLERHSLFFLLISLVLGALTGVGIWFVIQLIQPTGTSALIHSYVWAWAIEWALFVVEILAALLYYYTWKTLDGRRHLILAWIYFAAAYLSLVVINGIITFMLTPGRWLQGHGFWAGLLNPTYLPSLVLRTGISIGLAGVYALLTLSRERDEGFRLRGVRSAGIWVTVGFVLAALAAPWYVSALPEGVRSAVAGQWPAVQLWVVRGIACTAALVAVGLVFAVARPRLLTTMAASAILLLGLGQFASFEMIRELVRKPYVITGHLYSNSVYVEDLDRTREAGLLAAARWVDRGALGSPVRRGHQVFELACASCHGQSGYRSIGGVLRGYDAGRLRALLNAPEDLRWRMPPFPGKVRDADDLVAYLARRMRPLPPARDGREAYRRRCFACHDLRGGGLRPLSDSLEGMSPGEIDEFLAAFEASEDLSMPAFGGSEGERRLLAGWLAGELAGPGGDS